MHSRTLYTSEVILRIPLHVCPSPDSPALHLSFPRDLSPRKRGVGSENPHRRGVRQHPTDYGRPPLLHSPSLQRYSPSLHLTLPLSPLVIPVSSPVIPAKAGIHVLVADYRRPQVMPFRIRLFDEGYLPRSVPVLDPLFPLYGFVDVVMDFEVNR